MKHTFIFSLLVLITSTQLFAQKSTTVIETDPALEDSLLAYSQLSDTVKAIDFTLSAIAMEDEIISKMIDSLTKKKPDFSDVSFSGTIRKDNYYLTFLVFSKKQSDFMRRVEMLTEIKRSFKPRMERMETYLEKHGVDVQNPPLILYQTNDISALENLDGIIDSAVVYNELIDKMKSFTWVVSEFLFQTDIITAEIDSLNKILASFKDDKTVEGLSLQVRTLVVLNTTDIMYIKIMDHVKLFTTANMPSIERVKRLKVYLYGEN
jgi:hypothetical protein